MTDTGISDLIIIGLLTILLGTHIADNEVSPTKQDIQVISHKIDILSEKIKKLEDWIDEQD